MADPVLSVRDVTVAFDALRAVDEVTLAVPRGQRRAIIGPNGAGKTTLFNAITGMVLPTAGRITFDGHDLTRLPPHRRARLGIARTFQITNLFPTLSVEDNLVLALRGRSRRKFSLFGSPARDRHEQRRLSEALATARLPTHAGVPVRELSYGEQRQLEIALALVTSPALVLLDEPAAGLSPAERRIVADVIGALPRTLTIILIEHDMDLALGLAGMGKTTTMRSIMGLAPPMVRSGVIRWDGETLLGLPAHEIAARRIAIVPQGRRLFASLTVTEHLTILKGPGADTGWTIKRVFDLFPRLAERRRHRGGQLSGGERQMLAIARALMIDPELILMDEPSEGLAPVMVQHLERIVLDLKRENLSILLVEQNLYSALATADRVYVMETGAIVHEAPASTLTEKPELLLRHLGVQ